VWFVHSQTTVDPIDALFEQYDKALALFERNPYQAEKDMEQVKVTLNSVKEPSLTAADLWHDIGRFYFDQKADYTKALICFDNAYAIRRKQLSNEPTHNDLARSQFMIGVSQKYLGNYDIAMKHIEQSVKISTASNNAFMLAKEYLELGDICDYLGDYDKSIAYYENAYPNILNVKRDQGNLLGQHHKRLASLYFVK
jgi:tetratricopeptide (TPR) repeat protein